MTNPRASRSVVWVAVAALVTTTAWFATRVAADGTGRSFTFLAPGFTQDLYGVSADIADPIFGILGGVAFAPDGDVWSAECVFLGTRLHRFDSQTTYTAHATTLHPETIVDLTGLDQNPAVPPGGAGGCGLVNHPDGSIYSNSAAGVWKLDASTGLPVAGPLGPAGNALGIAVDPQGNHIVYVGADCHPQDGDPTTCTIWDLDTAAGTPMVFARLTRDPGEFIDGIYFDPTGEYLFTAYRSVNFETGETHHSLRIIRRPGEPGPLTAPVDDTQVAQVIPMVSEPDGVAFHAQEGFVVTLNESADCQAPDGTLTPGEVEFDPETGDLLSVCAPGDVSVGGTMTRFDFPGVNYEEAPTVSVYATGGFRGDLMQVGPDSCIYGTQGLLFEIGGSNGARYDDQAESGENSIVRICGGFAPPPGVEVESPEPGDLFGVAYHDRNRNGLLDPGEPGIDGVPVSLIGPVSGATLSLPDGSYGFTALEAGSYSLGAPAVATGKALGTPSPLSVELHEGESIPNNNFGYLSGNVAGYAYHDQNINGTRDVGEPGLGGVTIALSAPSFATQTTTTAADGSYAFAYLDSATYSDSATSSPVGMTLSTPSPLTIGLSPGQQSQNNNFGFVAIIPNGATITYSGQATVVRATVAGVTRVIADTGPVSPSGGAQQTSLPIVSVPGLLSATALSGSTNAGGGQSRTHAGLQNLNLTVFGHVITATAVTASATAVCSLTGPSVSGSTQILNLTVDGQPVTVDGTPNQTIALPLRAGQVVINEQQISGAGHAAAITVNALHVTLTSAQGVADVVIGSAHADIDCNAPISCVNSPSFSGKATVVDASLLGLTTRISDTEPLPPEGGTRQSILLSANIPGLLTADALNATTTGFGSSSHSSASVATLNLTVAGIAIGADVLRSDAHASCEPSGASVNGSSIVLNLTINGAAIAVTGQPNQTVTLPLGTGKVVINEQATTTAGNWSAITVSALHLFVTNVGDVAVSASHADVACTPPSRTWGGQGTVIDTTILNLTSRASDTGPLPRWGGSLRSALPSVNVAGLVNATLLSATTTGSADKSLTTTSAANVGVSVAGLSISASVLKSTAQATCTGTTASVTGSAQITALKINNIPILVTGQPNQVIPLVLGQLVINERVGSVQGSKGSMATSAIHLKLPGVADIALSSSRAEITCTPPPICPLP